MNAFRLLAAVTTVILLLPSSARGQDASGPSKNRLPHCVVTLIDEAEVPAREAGVLVSLDVHKGMPVQQGNVLAQIDDMQARMAKKIAQLEFEAASKEAENNISVRAAQAASLVAEAEYQEAAEANRRVPGTITPSEVRRLLLTYRRSQLQIELAELEFAVTGLTTRAKQAQVEAAENAIQRRKIEAPLGGVIAEVHKHAGEWVNPGDPLLRIVRMDKLRVEGYVNVADFAPQEVLQRPVSIEVRLARGQLARVNSTVQFVSPLVEASGEYRIGADIVNQAVGDLWLISPGLSAEMVLNVQATR